jgi:rhamnosyltransferase
MIAGIVVLYYPSVAILERLLVSVIGQVDMLFAVDNTPSPSAEVAILLGRYQKRAIYIPLGDNLGVGAAQNVGIEESIKASCSHVLLLDQDSVLPAGMVEQLLAAESALVHKGELVAAVGPQFVDEKNGKRSPAIRHHYFRIERLYLDAESKDAVETEHLIASGSIIRTSVLQQVGTMNADLFIDWVDVEWVLRARSMGYKSYYIPNVVMRHNVGDSIVVILGRDVHVHSDLRNYYMLRNAIYLFRLKSVGWKWKAAFAPRIPCYLVLYPFLSNNRIANLRFVLRALWDGLRGNIGRLGEAPTHSAT